MKSSGGWLRDSAWKSAFVWALLPSGLLIELTDRVPQIWAWLSPILCAPGQHLQGESDGGTIEQRCVAPGLTPDLSTDHGIPAGVILVVLYGISWVATYWALGTLSRRKQPEQSHPANPHEVNLAASATQPPSVSDYPTEDSVGQRVAPGETIRCQLIPLPFVRGRPPAPLALDVGKDAIWAVDPNTNALVASVWLAQATAIPATFIHQGGEMGVTWKTPILVVHVPGLPPLSIGAPTMEHSSFWKSGPQPRFSWRGKLPPAKHPSAVPLGGEPAYSVTDAEWLTLVEKFGLAPYLQRNDGKG